MVKHIRLQLIFLMAVMTAFTGALASCKPNNITQGAVLSIFAAFPVGVLEIQPSLLVQMDSDDADLGTTFCKSPG